MIKRLFLVSHAFLLGFIMLLLLLALILFNPYLFKQTAQYFLEENNISYSELEGTLYGGFNAKNVKYETLFEAQEISLSYDLLWLLTQGISLNDLHVKNAVLNLEKIPQSEGNKTAIVIPKISFKNIDVTNFTILAGETISLSAALQNSTFEMPSNAPEGIIHVKNLSANVNTRFADASLKGSINNNVFSGNAYTALDKQYFNDYLQPLQNFPQKINIDIHHASANKLNATVLIDTFTLKEHDVRVSNLKAHVDYLFSQDNITLNADYILDNNATSLEITQQLFAAFEGSYKSQLNVNILKSDFELPEYSFSAEVKGDLQSLDLHLASASGKLDANISSSDLQSFSLNIRAKKLSTDFLSSLPKELHHRSVDLNASANIHLSNGISATGNAELLEHSTQIKSTFEFINGNFVSQGSIAANADAPQWHDINTGTLFPVNFVVHYSKDEDVMLALKANEVYATLFKREQHINGWGSYRTSRFDIEGEIEDAQSVLHVNQHIESVYELLNAFTPLNYGSFEYYDAEIIAQSTLSIGSDLKVKSSIKIPWYVAQSDSQTINFGHDSSIDLVFENNMLAINEYTLNMLEHSITAKKQSQLYLDEQNILHVKKFWIFDNLLLTGLYHIENNHINMKLQSDRFTYAGKEADLSASANITIVTDKLNNINVEGSLELLDGLIKYYPSKSYLAQDDDIIILQDVKAPKKSNISLNVQITAAKAIPYKAHDIDLLIKPDLTLWKELKGPLVILGLADIPGGKVLLQDKRYIIEPSKIYFGGDYPVNPFLDMNILYEIDYKHIYIYVTHTMEDPVILFSSTPSLSQNDIMSYLIFGTPSSSAFEGGEELSGASAANLVLGIGLKKMISDTTGIKVDTLNILNSQNGGLGFEVGTQVSDRLRILLKNDVEFSAILQYKLNRWLRLDVDVKETGQGVRVIYVKDMRDPFK